MANVSSELAESSLILIGWQDSGETPVTEVALATFLKAKIGNEVPAIKTGNVERFVILEFASKKNVGFLRKKFEDDRFWQIDTMKGVEDLGYIKVSNLPKRHRKDRSIYHFFKNKNACGKDVKSDCETSRVNEVQDWCVLRLNNPTEARELIRTQETLKAFDGHKLKLSEFYEELYAPDAVHHKGGTSSAETHPVTIDNIPKEKLQFLKLHHKDKLLTELNCRRIDWPTDNACKLTVHCEFSGDKKSAEKDVKKRFKEVLNSISRTKKTITSELPWSEVSKKFCSRGAVMVELDQPNLVVVGFEKSEEYKTLLAEIDAIKPPLTERISVSDKLMLEGFEKLKMLEKSEQECGIKIELDVIRKQIKMTGHQDRLASARTKVLEHLNTLKIEKYPFPNKAYGEILSTPMMQAMVSASLDSVNVSCSIVPEQLVVFTRDEGPSTNKNLDDVHTLVFGMIAEDDITREGTVISKDSFITMMADAAGKYSPYVNLSPEVTKTKVDVKIVCGTGYLDLIKTEILKVFDQTISETEAIELPKHVFDYMQQGSMDKLLKKIKDKKGFTVDQVGKRIRIAGNKSTRQNLRKEVLAAAGDVKTSWKPIEKEGVVQFLSENLNVKFLKEIQQSYKCKIETVTKNEMKKLDLSCIVLLSSGQAVFAVNGDIFRLTSTVDAIVNPTSTILQHCTALSKTLIQYAGDEVRLELEDYVKANGPLPEGGVYTTSKGQLPCLRIIHMAIANDPNSRHYDRSVVGKAMENAFEAMDKEVLKSVAITLPAQELTAAAVRSVEACLGKHTGVREVYFYDRDAQSARHLKTAMDQLFTSRCFHLPENSALGEGQMSVKQKDVLTERSGCRIIPLPGDKRIVIEWGTMAETKADVIVCPTPKAPYPEGKIFRNLKDASRIDLGKLCADEFKGVGNVPDGTLVETVAGSLGCQMIYHIKICDKWTNSKELSKYLETCLQQAAVRGVATIAIPPLGVAECGYPGSDVAATTITTIAGYLQLHMACTLTEVKVVVFKRDQDMTFEFDERIRTVYSQRPHRLDAVIEDTMVSAAMLNKVIQQPPAGADHRPAQANVPQPSPSIPQGAPDRIQIDNNSILRIVKGRIEKAQGDVIVCTTPEFPKLRGVISDSLKKTGGKAIQADVEKKYAQGFQGPGVPAGASGNLACKQLFYIRLSDYSKPQDLQIIYDKVTSCLDQAEKAKYQSIIFPTIGTGGFKFPAQDSADKTFEAVRSYFQKGTTHLRKVVVVVFEGTPHLMQTFQASAAQCFNVKLAFPAVQRGPDLAQTVSNSVWKVPRSQTTVELKYGNIEKWRADVILDTTTSFPNLNGAIAACLQRAAGHGLLAECQGIPGISEGGIAVTGGHGLACKRVYHYLMPPWSPHGERMVTNCVTDCLTSMKQSGLTSIAMPAIGTGGYNYPAHLVASGIYSAAETFGKAHPSDDMRITVVLFVQAANVNQAFHDQLKIFAAKVSGLAAPFETAAKKGVHFAVDDEVFRHQPGPLVSKKGEFLLFRFTSDDQKKIDSAYEEIIKKVEAASVTQQIDMDDKETEIMKDTRFKEEMEKYGTSSHVYVRVDLDKKNILFQGIGDGVNQCHKKVLTSLQERKRQLDRQFIGRHVYKYLEWCYTEDNGSIWVPYPKHIAFELENSNAEKIAEYKFQDTNDKWYVVNFNRMEEYEENKKDGTTIAVVRKDLAVEEHTVPAEWEPMGATENLRRVPLVPSSQEYKDVEACLNTSLKQRASIFRIERIQNKTLYMLYQTKKKQLEAKAKGQVERSLWHGAKEDTEMSIVSNNFNRGYSGQTHKGQVWYGHGCYFAVESSYAVNDYYAPAYKDGKRRIYQVAVLTGNTTSVPQGYSERFAPEIPGTQNERYDSVCDDMKHPKEFVIFNDTQAYPKYIIIFQ